MDADSAEEDDDDEFARTMVIDSSDVAARGNGGSAPAVEHHARVEDTIGADAGAQPISVAKIQVLNGTFAGREVVLNKAVTTLGRPGAQVIAITRRADGYHIVQVENEEGRKPSSVNGEPLTARARVLADNDVIEIIGIKMGFFAD